MCVFCTLLCSIWCWPSFEKEDTWQDRPIFWSHLFLAFLALHAKGRFSKEQNRHWDRNVKMILIFYIAHKCDSVKPFLNKWQQMRQVIKWSSLFCPTVFHREYWKNGRKHRRQRLLPAAWKGTKSLQKCKIQWFATLLERWPPHTHTHLQLLSQKSKGATLNFIYNSPDRRGSPLRSDITSLSQAKSRPKFKPSVWGLYHVFI